VSASSILAGLSQARADSYSWRSLYTVYATYMPYIPRYTPWRPTKSAGCMHVHILTVWRFISNPTCQSMRRPIFRLLEEQSCKISFRSDLKGRSLRLFLQSVLNNNNNNTKMSSDMGSVPDPKQDIKRVCGKDFTHRDKNARAEKWSAVKQYCLHTKLQSLKWCGMSVIWKCSVSSSLVYPM